MALNLILLLSLRIENRTIYSSKHVIIFLRNNLFNTQKKYVGSLIVITIKLEIEVQDINQFVLRYRILLDRFSVTFYELQNSFPKSIACIDSMHHDS